MFEIATAEFNELAYELDMEDENKKANKLLKNGWEPFAISKSSAYGKTIMWFKRKLKVKQTREA